MRARGYLPGERIYHQFLREYKPGFALARQWAGFTEEIEMLRKEIGRLQVLIHKATADLRELGADRPTGSSAASNADNCSVIDMPL